MDPEALFAKDVLFVSGKGGTGKTTVAAAMATAAAAGGRRVLLAEVEGRGQVARALGVPDPGFHERDAPGGFRILSITPREALIEYLDLFGLRRVSGPLFRSGAADQVMGAAPGFRDLLACGKVYEIVRARRTHPKGRDRPRYDLVVVDAPPTGQIAAFLGAPAAYADLFRVGRVRQQALSAARLLRERCHVVLVATAEEMAVAETLEAVPAVIAAGVPVAGVVANRMRPPVFPPGTVQAFRRLGPDGVGRVARAAGLDLPPKDAASLHRGGEARHERYRLQRFFRRQLDEAGPVLELPEVISSDPERVALLGEAILGRRRTPRTSRPAPEPGEPWHPAPQPFDLDQLLGPARVVLVCGSGGVGKTTISAAIALHRARAGRDTALLTVDPARRLATALRLPTTAGDRADVSVGRGRRLTAMQLDTQRTFDELVRRYAGTPERRDRILENTFYRRIADSLSGTHEYMAMEKLYELAREERHDVIVIDTPPTRSALAFLDAPERLNDFLGGRVLRLILVPTARAGRFSLGVARLGATAFARTIGRLVGAEALADLVDFLRAFEGMFGGFRDRAARVTELLRSPECAFVVVATPTEPSLDEAGSFVDRLAEGRMRAAAVLVNRWHGGEVDLPDEADAARSTLSRGSAEDRAVAAALGDHRAAEPSRAAARLAVDAFATAHPTVALRLVPELAGDVHDVSGLGRVSDLLFGSPSRGIPAVSSVERGQTGTRRPRPGIRPARPGGAGGVTG